MRLSHVSITVKDESSRDSLTIDNNSIILLVILNHMEYSDGKSIESGNAGLGKVQSENVDVWNKLIAAFERNDIEEALSYVTDDVTWRVWMPEELPIGGLFSGRDGVLQFFNGHKLMFKMEMDEQLEVFTQGDKVVVYGHERARIMPADRIYDAEYTLVFTFRDGKISRCSIFGDGAKLLKAYRGS